MFMSIKGYGGYVALTWHKRKAVAFVPLKVFGFKLSQTQKILNRQIRRLYVYVGNESIQMVNT